MTKAAAAGQLVADAAEKAAGAVIEVGKKALDSYATFEQLQGGVEKLYGDAADKVLDYANKAYQSVQMSANEYLENATSMAGALKRSLGDDADALADYTDKAMRQIADNASVFGSDIEFIERAYSGFARSQFLMLDNLKLGYAGTKEGMKELLADAEKISGIHYDMDSYADIIDAIQIIQDKMNITGNAAKEAMQTIEGAGNATKAAWENALTALMSGSEEDFEKSLTNLITTAENYLSLVGPRFKGALDVAWDYVKEHAPEWAQSIYEEFSGKFETLDWDKIGDDIVNGIVDAVGGFAEGFNEKFPELYSALQDFILKALEEVNNNVEEYRGQIEEVFASLFSMMVTVIKTKLEEDPEFFYHLFTESVDLAYNISLIIEDMQEEMKTQIAGLFDGIWDETDFSSIFSNLGEKLTTEFEQTINDWINGTTTTTTSKLYSMWSKWTEVSSLGINTMIADIRNKLAQAGAQYIQDHIQSIENDLSLVEAVWDKFVPIAEEAMQNMKTAASNKLTDLGAKLKEKVVAAASKVKEAAKDFVNAGKELGEALLNAILEALSSLGSKIVEMVTKAKASISSIATPAPKRTGIEYVPSDGYLASLHRGEMVLTAAEADRYRKGINNKTDDSVKTVNNYTINVPQNDNAYETAVTLRRLLREEEEFA